MIKKCQLLLETARVQTPVIGVYDTPDPEAFDPLVRPGKGKWACLFYVLQQLGGGEESASNTG